jgi:hypothetical protein
MTHEDVLNSLFARSHEIDTEAKTTTLEVDLGSGRTFRLVGKLESSPGMWDKDPEDYLSPEEYDRAYQAWVCSFKYKVIEVKESTFESDF